jgi:serine/threonine protein kinase
LPRLGRYELIARLAVGGMAEVYLARHGELSGFKTLVVVKKVLPHLAENPEFISMFLDEARIASLLDHPNVVASSRWAAPRTTTSWPWSWCRASRWPR